MKTLEETGTNLAESERMELIWVNNGIKPVGEIKRADSGTKQLLNQFGFFTDFYGQSLFYSKNDGHLKEIKRATNSGDSVKAGQLWGYPSCCVKYFSGLKSRYSDPYKANLEMTKGMLRKGRKAYAYFLDYTHCPECITVQNSPSRNLEDRLAEVLKSEDYDLYKEFKRKSEGNIILLNGLGGKGTLLWDYRH